MPAWNSARMWATGKPQPLAWCTGLAEVGLQLRGIGHGERRAVLQKCAMAEPESHRLGGRNQALDHLAEDRPIDGQRECGTCLTEGGRGEGAASQQRDVGQGGVAVEDLNEEPVNDGRRSQEAAIRPGVARRRGKP